MIIGHLGRRYLTLALCVPPLVAACNDDEPCTLEARAGLNVTVLNAKGARVCDAIVTAREGTFSEQLMVLGDASSCTYSGVYERAGTYSLEVVSTGSKSKTVPDLVVSPGRCHVEGPLVTVTLEAENTGDGGADAGDASAD